MLSILVKPSKLHSVIQCGLGIVPHRIAIKLQVTQSHSELCIRPKGHLFYPYILVTALIQPSNVEASPILIYSTATYSEIIVHWKHAKVFHSL